MTLQTRERVRGRIAHVLSDTRVRQSEVTEVRNFGAVVLTVRHRLAGDRHRTAAGSLCCVGESFLPALLFLDPTLDRVDLAGPSYEVAVELRFRIIKRSTILIGRRFRLLERVTLNVASVQVSDKSFAEFLPLGAEFVEQRLLNSLGFRHWFPFGVVLHPGPRPANQRLATREKGVAANPKRIYSAGKKASL